MPLEPQLFRLFFYLLNVIHQILCMIFMVYYFILLFINDHLKLCQFLFQFQIFGLKLLLLMEGALVIQLEWALACYFGFAQIKVQVVDGVFFVAAWASWAANDWRLVLQKFQSFADLLNLPMK